MDLAGLIIAILNILTLLLFARAICSWIDPGFRSTIGRLLFDITEPLIAPIRQVVPPVGMLDLSIMVALFLLVILRQLVASAL
ncbi:MAG TPA: YggT family protein [Thermomicrobiales bacterium]|nr:YggT family protein [Thermomicrobiales bacterium]